MTSNNCVPDVSIEMGDYKFLSSPIVLGDSDIDLILGMYWLSKHKAQLDCAARQIQLTHSSEDVIIYAAHDDTIRLFYLNEKGEWMPSLRFQLFVNIKTSFQKSFQECLLTGQLNSSSILSLAWNLFANILTSLDLKS